MSGFVSDFYCLQYLALGYLPNLSRLYFLIYIMGIIMVSTPTQRVVQRLEQITQGILEKWQWWYDFVISPHTPINKAKQLARTTPLHSQNL